MHWHEVVVMLTCFQRPDECHRGLLVVFDVQQISIPEAKFGTHLVSRPFTSEAQIKKLVH